MLYRRARLSIAGLAVLSLLILAPGNGSTASPGAAPRTTVPVFVLQDGRYTGFDVPYGFGAGELIGINNRGTIVGGYDTEPSGGCVRGFLRDRAGRFTRIDVPGAPSTQPIDINDSGQIVGSFLDSCPEEARLRAFVRDERGRFTTIRIPDAISVQGFGIDNRGRVVGQYVDQGGTAHGYVWDAGRVTGVDGPEGAAGAAVFDVNDRGTLVGGYLDSAGAIHGFQLSRGRYTTIEAPDAAFTFPFGINNAGQVAGFLLDQPVLDVVGARGFVLRQGAGGPFAPVRFPGSDLGTGATDINDRGTVVGLYRNPR